jgi:hypothetical protein
MQAMDGCECQQQVDDQVSRPQNRRESVTCEVNDRHAFQSRYDSIAS